MRLIDADEIIKVAEHAYHEWNLAMAAADTNRQVNLTYKMQDLCKAVKAVAEAAPAIDPESLRPQGEWISRFARHWKGRDECSRCGFHEKDHRDLSHYNYCPKCGARMRKGIQNDQV